MLETGAAMNPNLLVLAKTSQATFSKYFINHKNPVCTLILLAAWIFSICFFFFFFNGFNYYGSFSAGSLISIFQAVSTLNVCLCE